MLVFGFFLINDAFVNQFVAYKLQMVPFKAFTVNLARLKILRSKTRFEVRCEHSPCVGSCGEVEACGAGDESGESCLSGGMARSFVSGIERGTVNASLESIWKLAQALRCKPSDLWLVAERLRIPNQFPFVQGR